MEKVLSRSCDEHACGWRRPKNDVLLWSRDHYREQDACTGREPRKVGGHGFGVKGQIRVQALHDRAYARVLHRDRCNGVVMHAEPQPAKGVPGEPTDGRGRLFRTGNSGRRQLSKRRGDRPGAGGRYDDMEDVHPELHTYRAHRVRWFVERPKP